MTERQPQPAEQVPQPERGGSYLLDPATGRLTRQAWTRSADDAAPPDQPAQPE